MSAHTPGPWHVREYLDDETLYIDGKKNHGNSSSVAHIPAPNCYHFDALLEKEANARLIAAAPELLEALESISQMTWALRSGGPDSMDLQGLSDALTEATDIAYAAIAKATGDQP